MIVKGLCKVMLENKKLNKNIDTCLLSASIS